MCELAKTITLQSGTPTRERMKNQRDTLPFSIVVSQREMSHVAIPATYSHIRLRGGKIEIAVSIKSRISSHQYSASQWWLAGQQLSGDTPADKIPSSLIDSEVSFHSFFFLCCDAFSSELVVNQDLRFLTLVVYSVSCLKRASRCGTETDDAVIFIIH